MPAAHLPARWTALVLAATLVGCGTAIAPVTPDVALAGERFAKAEPLDSAALDAAWFRVRRSAVATSIADPAVPQPT
jgi:hypothetical protein